LGCHTSFDANSLPCDDWLLFATCGVRSFAYGFLSVVLGVYLDAVGLTAMALGWIFTVRLPADAVRTIVITAIEPMLHENSGFSRHISPLFVINGRFAFQLAYATIQVIPKKWSTTKAVYC
jgi:hypothetical protein